MIIFHFATNEYKRKTVPTGIAVGSYLPAKKSERSLVIRTFSGFGGSF